MFTIGRCSLIFLVFVCFLKVNGKDCETIRANRSTRFEPEGGSLSLSCEVVHCEVTGWSGGWAFKDTQSNTFTPLTPSSRIQLFNASLTVNRTMLILIIQNINQTDAGSYQCAITWPRHTTSSGHVTYVNVTAAIDSSGRKLSFRLLVCFGALMCCPLALGFAYCLSRDHPSPPPVPSHPRTSYSARVKLKKELVYAEVSSNDLKRQNHHSKQVYQPTVYSSLHFPSSSTALVAAGYVTEANVQ